MKQLMKYITSFMIGALAGSLFSYYAQSPNQISMITSERGELYLIIEKNLGNEMMIYNEGKFISIKEYFEKIREKSGIEEKVKNND